MATSTLHGHRAESYFPQAEDTQGGPTLEPTSSRAALLIPRHHCPLEEGARVSGAKSHRKGAKTPLKWELSQTVGVCCSRPMQGQKRQLASSPELPTLPTSRPHQDCSTSRLPSGGPPFPASCCRRFHWISSSSRMMVCCFRSSCRVFWCFSASSCMRAQQPSGSRGAAPRAQPRTRHLALPSHSCSTSHAPPERGDLLSSWLCPPLVP